MQPISTNTRCVARFFTFKKRGSLDSDDTNSTMDTEEFIEDNAIIGCSISREKASPSANFQLTIKPTKNFYNLVKPGDWVMIYLDDSSNIDLKKLKGLKIVGIVNRVAFNKVTNNDGSIQTTYTIHGSDFGKIFEVTEFFYNPYVPVATLSAFLASLQKGLQGSPLDYANFFLKIFLGNAKELGFEDIIFQELVPSKIYEALNSSGNVKGTSVSFYDILKRNFKDDTNEGFAFWKDLTNLNSTNLWQALQQSANTVINEMFTDLRDGQPTLIFRKQLLTKDQILEQAKSAVEVPEQYILNQNLGTSDHEVFNYIAIYDSGSLIKNLTYNAAAQGKLPLIAKDSIKRYGFRRIDRSTEYLFQGASFAFDLVAKWCEELKEYWYNANRFENGTIEVMGVNNFKIGEFIKIPEQDKIYMVESISWDWQYGGHLFTSLTVNYGMFDDGKFVDEDQSDKYGIGTTTYIRNSDKDFTV